MIDSDNVSGWFFEGDKLFYKFISDKIPDNGVFVEIGCWLGKSSLYFSSIKKKNQKLICVDTWEGTPNEINTNHVLVKHANVFDLFMKNMEGREFEVIKNYSIEAAKTFEDYSLDAVFIDGDHTYDAVRSDILSWYPKVKIGGYISGHDFGQDAVREAVLSILPNAKRFNIEGYCWYLQK